MDNKDDHYLMLSGIQHYQFCKRQWALIDIEQQWHENVRTIEGKYLHRNADQALSREKRGDLWIVRALPIKSDELKITGICDVVEFKKEVRGVYIPRLSGNYGVNPVEYKRGRSKWKDEDILQLAAEAMCLEEMFLCSINKGYLFYNEIKRRVEVELTQAIKNKVRTVFSEMHSYFARKYTPKVKPGPFCKNCSLQNICLPKLLTKKSVKNYIKGKLQE